MSAPESDIQARIMLGVGALPGVRVFRNTIGEGWQGERVHSNDRTLVVLKRARYVTFGLAPGSPDLIGWRSVIITPDMVGRVVGQIVGIEVKAQGQKPRTDQARFLATMTAAGGLAGYWHDPAAVRAALLSAGLVPDVQP